MSTADRCIRKAMRFLFCVMFESSREIMSAVSCELFVEADLLHWMSARCTLMKTYRGAATAVEIGQYFLCFSWKAGEYTSVRERSCGISCCVVECCLIERDSWPVIYFAHAVAHRLCTLSWGVDEGRFVESRFQYISQPGVVTELCFAQLLCWWRPVRRKKSPVWYFTTRSCDWVVFLPSQPERYERSISCCSWFAASSKEIPERLYFAQLLCSSIFHNQVLWMSLG